MICGTCGSAGLRVIAAAREFLRHVRPVPGLTALPRQVADREAADLALGRGLGIEVGR